jgi:hypothetical protein
MPYGSNEAAKRAAGRKHARRTWTCKCGRKVRGNAYHVHKRACSTWLAWAEENGVRIEPR